MINTVLGLVEERHTESLQAVVPERKCRWPTGKWRDAEHPNHQGKVNQNYNKLSSHTCQNGDYQKEHTQKKPNASEDVEKKEPSYIVAGNVNWCGHCGKHYGGFSKKVKTGLLLGIYPKNPPQNTNLKRYMYMHNLILYVLLRGNKLTQVVMRVVQENRWEDEGVGLSH